MSSSLIMSMASPKTASISLSLIRVRMSCLARLSARRICARSNRWPSQCSQKLMVVFCPPNAIVCDSVRVR